MTHSRIRSHLDAPAPGDSVDASDITVRGWIAADSDPAGVAAIEVWNADHIVATTTDFYERQDVVAALGLPPAARNGFTVYGLPVTEGTALTITARMRDGGRETIAVIDLGKLKRHKTPLGALRAGLRPNAVGLEIGAHVNPVPGLTPFYTDTVPVFAGSKGRVDFLSDGTALPLPDGCLDYLCASHVLEHLPNPLGALFEWTRVLRPEGYLYLVVPDKRHTFDHRRRTTPVGHLLDDFVLGATAFTRVANHVDEFVFQTDWRKLRPDCPPEEENRQREAAKAVYEAQLANGDHIDIHFHAFTPDSLADLLTVAGFNGGADFEIVSWAESYPAERRDGIGVLLRKTSGRGTEPATQSFALAHRIIGNPPLPLVCPQSLAPLGLESRGNGHVLVTVRRREYELRDGTPILLPPRGGKVPRAWNRVWHRSAIYLAARLRTGTLRPDRRRVGVSPAGP